MFSPFKLLYGEEAMKSEEIKHGSCRTEIMSHEDMNTMVDTIEAGKMQAAINLRKYQDETRKWKNKKVRPRHVKEGDLVIRRIPKIKLKGKMNNKWEGPFMARPEACKLRSLDGIDDPYSWNKDMLQKYFV